MKIYLSHSIRGSAGKDATPTQMQLNCNTAIEIGKRLRKTFPNIDFYIPGESEPFVQRAFDKKYMNEKQILDVDCSIIDSCDAVIIYIPEDDELNGGRLVEYDYATSKGIPLHTFGWLVDVEYWIARQIIRN